MRTKRVPAAAVALVLFLCASLPGKGNGEEQALGEPISYLSMYGAPSLQYREVELIRGFERDHPEWQVSYRPVPYEEYDHSLKTYLASGQPPDLLTAVAGNAVSRLVREGLLADLASLIPGEILQGESVSPGEGPYREYPYNREILSFLPSHRYGWGVYYKPSLFNRLHLDAPESWPDFLELCEDLKNKGIIPLAEGARFAWTGAAWFEYLNLRLNGPDFHGDLLAGQATYTDPRIRDVFDHWAVLIAQGYFPASARDLSWIEGLDLLTDDQAALYLMGDFLEEALPPGEREDIACFAFPTIAPGLKRGEIAPSEGFLIPSGASNLRGGAALLSFFLEEGHAGIAPVSPEDGGSLTRRIVDDADMLFQPYLTAVPPLLATAAEEVFRRFREDPSAETIRSSLLRLEEARLQAGTAP